MYIGSTGNKEKIVLKSIIVLNVENIKKKKQDLEKLRSVTKWMKKILQKLSTVYVFLIEHLSVD